MKKNLKRYLIYAIGEILLVVIGILIALKVSNWNEIQKNNIAFEALMDNLENVMTNNLEEASYEIDNSYWNLETQT